MKKHLLIISVFVLASLAHLAAQNIPKPNIPGPAGLKVNSYTGGLFYQRTDLFIPGKGPSIDLTFYYNSFNTALDKGFGPGWTMTYNMYYEPDSTGIIIRRSDGRKDVFTLNGSVYNAPVGIFDTLVKYQPDKFRLTSKNGMNYFFDDSTHKRLTKITDPNNNQLIVSYTAGLPTAITDASGRRVSLNYTTGHLTNITDTNFIPARQITYVNNTTGSPIKVINPVGDSVKYEYDQVRNMTKITEQSGSSSRLLENSVSINYPNCVQVGGIISSLNSMSFSFDTAQLKTTVTEPVISMTQSTSYTFFTSGNLKEKMGNCCGFHKQYNYDAQNNISQITDANGNPYSFTHDTKGNTLSETDPLGGVMTYMYQLLFNRITSVTDKKGNTITYTYDANGNLLTINKPLGNRSAVNRSPGNSEQYTYDSFGNVISYTDGRGNTTQYQYNIHGYRTLTTYPDNTTNSFTYDNVGNRLTSTNANGNTSTYEYDKLNRLKKTTDALGNMTTYTYDPRSNLVSVKDALNHTTSYTYDALNRRTSATTPAGTSSMTYDEKGNMLTSTDNNGNITTYTYNTQNLLATEKDALNHTRSFIYDPNGNRLTETDFNNYLTTYTYDSLNRLKKVTDALSNKTEYGYDANSNRITVKDANNNTTTYVYDSLNRVKQVQRPIGTTTHVYDENNNRTSITDPNGYTTSFKYDVRDRDSLTTDALNHNTKYFYDAQGNDTAVVDRNNHTTHYHYDVLNRRTKTINPLGEADSVVYDAVGNTKKRILANGNMINYVYDSAYRVTGITDLSGPVASYTYDANSNRKTAADGLGHATTNFFNSLNRVKIITDALGDSTLYFYDNNSNVLSIKDRNGHTTNYVFDSLNRKIKTIHPEGNKDSVVYDAVGNTLKMIDDNLNATAWQYDVNDRLITETYADASTKRYAYDASGNTTRRIDNNGDTTIYAYDPLNRLVLRNYPGTNDDIFSYDFEGRMTAANNNNANITYTYDNADRMLSENMNGKTTAYAYNIPNKKRTLTYPGGRNIEEDYDVRMRLSVIKDASTPLSTYAYDSADRIVTRTFSNGVTTNYSYNNNDWTTSVNHTGVAQFNYGFDNEGNRLFAAKAHRPTNSEKYVYDNDDRLTNFKEGTLSGGNIPAPLTQTQYNYDGVGNRTTIVKDATTTTYTANAVNAYTNINDGSSTTPTYDANGNTLTDGTHTNSFDFENRLISVGAGTTAAYKYDALGRRIQKVTSTGTINYYYDDNRIIEERNGADVLQATYVYGIWIDDILSMRRGGTDYFYHQNSLGSVAAVTDNTGAVAERYEYDAYGKLTIYDGSYTLQTATAIGNTYMFTGREYDAETGNNHYRARFYKPDWGRFGQRDPLRYINGMNTYISFNNNSINLFDPMGLSPWSRIKDFFRKLRGPWRGNYLGPGNNPGTTPIDPLDEACCQHDMAYDAAGVGGICGALTNTSVAQADEDLAFSAAQSLGQNKDLIGEAWAVGVTNLFYTLSKIKKCCKWITSIFHKQAPPVPMPNVPINPNQGPPLQMPTIPVDPNFRDPGFDIPVDPNFRDPGFFAPVNPNFRDPGFYMPDRGFHSPKIDDIPFFPSVPGTGGGRIGVLSPSEPLYDDRGLPRESRIGDYGAGIFWSIPLDKNFFRNLNPFRK